MRTDPLKLLGVAQKIAQKELPKGMEARVLVTDYLMEYGLGIVDLEKWKLVADVRRKAPELRTEQDAKDMAIQALKKAGVKGRDRSP